MLYRNSEERVERGLIHPKPAIRRFVVNGWFKPKVATLDDADIVFFGTGNGLQKSGLTRASWSIQRAPDGMVQDQGSTSANR